MEHFVRKFVLILGKTEALLPTQDSSGIWNLCRLSTHHLPATARVPPIATHDIPIAAHDPTINKEVEVPGPRRSLRATYGSFQTKKETLLFLKCWKETHLMLPG